MGRFHQVAYHAAVNVIANCKSRRYLCKTTLDAIRKGGRVLLSSVYQKCTKNQFLLSGSSISWAEFFERFTAQAIANMVIEWAEDGMKVPPEKMALMDCVATRGIYGMIDSVN